MNTKMQKIIEEMTTNFSDLFIETLYLRYLKEFPQEDFLEVIKIASDSLSKKMNLKIVKKLKKLGYK